MLPSLMTVAAAVARRDADTVLPLAASALTRPVLPLLAQSVSMRLALHLAAALNA